MRLFLVRHAQTSSNVAGALDTTVPGARLTALGHRQARAAAGVLVARGVTDVHVSPLVRTHQTAAPLATTLGITPTVHDGLAEIQAGSLEMRTDREALVSYGHTVRSWLSGDLTARLGGGITGHQFVDRYDAAVAAIASQGREGAAVAFSHGAAIRTWVALRAQNTGDLLRLAGVESPLDAHLRNTGCIELHGDSETGWRAWAWETLPLGGADLDEPDPLG